MQPLTSCFSYRFPIFWVQLPLLLPLPFFPVSVPDISPVEAASLNTFFPYSTIFFVDFGGSECLTARRTRRRWNVHLRLFCDPGCVVQIIGEIGRRGLGKRVFGVRTTSWEYRGDVPGSPVSVSTPLRLEGLGSGGLALQVSPLVVGQSQPGVNGYEDPSSQRRLLSIDSRGIGCFYNSPIVSNVELTFFEDFFDY